MSAIAIAKDERPCCTLVLCGHTHFRRGGKESVDLPYSQLFHHTVECGPITLGHMTADDSCGLVNCKVQRGLRV